MEAPRINGGIGTANLALLEDPVIPVLQNQIMYQQQFSARLYNGSGIKTLR